MPLMISAIISSVETPSISFSGVNTIRWRSTAGAAYTISSGVTKSRPAIAANAYAALAQLREQSAGLSRDVAQEGGVNFGSVLKDVMNNVTAVGRKSDVQALDVANGKANMIDVVTAVAESETAIQTLVAVRDKVIAAYEDILKMPI